MASQPDDSSLAVVVAWVEEGARLHSAALLKFASETDFLFDAFPRSRGFNGLSLATLTEAMQVARKDAKDVHENKRLINISAANGGKTIVAHVVCEPLSTMTATRTVPSEVSSEYIYVINMVVVEGKWKFGHVIEFKLDIV